MLRRLLVLLWSSAVMAGCGLLAPSESSDPADTVQSRWWTWAASEPAGSDPVTDLTGQFCDRNQPAGVWFLATMFGGHAERRCSVPAGRPIVFPVINYQHSFIDFCVSFMEVAAGLAELEAYGCGLWVWLLPLPPGSHELRIRGLAGDIANSVDYHLDVIAPTVAALAEQ